MTNVKKTNILILLLFFGDALVSPFLALNFIHLGFNTNELSILIALKPICTIIGNFIYGHFAKDIKRDINLLKIISLFCVGCLLGFVFAKTFIFCLFLMIIWSLNNSPLFSILDGVADKFCEKENKAYSITRMFGSIGYCVSLLLGGILGVGDVLNYQLIFSIASVIFIGVFISLFFLKSFDMENGEKKKISFKVLFGNKRFVIYMLFYFFALGIWRITDDYASELFNSIGLSDGQWSFLYAGQVIVEIICILLINRFVKKERYYFLVLISAILMCVRTFLFTLPIPQIALVVSTGVLRGLCWGTFIPGHMYILEKMLGSSLVTKAVSLLTIEINAFSFIGNLFYLNLKNNIGVQFLYIGLGTLQFLGIIFFLLIDFSFLKKQNKDRSI